MNLKAFFVDALTSALELGLGTPDDVLRHITPDVLAHHLPRPLWARLLTACMGAPRVDAQLVVETIGVPNLCEHAPANLIWACIAEIGLRSIGKTADEIVPLVTPRPPIVAAPASASTSAPRVPLAPPPPETTPAPAAAPARPTPVPGAPAIPSPALADLIDELEQDSPPQPARARTASQRFRQSNTGINRPLGTSGTRRPQAQAPAVTATTTGSTPRPPGRRGSTEADQDETAAETDWRNREPIAVDDSQLVDWQTETTASTDDDFGRKR